MLGVKKEQLVTGLCRISCRLCGYSGSMCDCKYMREGDDFQFFSEETGCPETTMASNLINAMTLEEFYTIAKRAGIRISENDNNPLDLTIIFKKLQTQRDEKRRTNIKVSTGKRSK